MYDRYVSCNITVSVTFIDKTDPSNPLEREWYWRYILQTNVPHYFNIADGVQLSLFNVLHFHGIDF